MKIKKKQLLELAKKLQEATTTKFNGMDGAYDITDGSAQNVGNILEEWVNKLNDDNS